MDVDVEITGGAAVGESVTGEVARIANEGGGWIGGKRDEGEGVEGVRGVAEGAGRVEAVLVEEVAALPARVDVAGGG